VLTINHVVGSSVVHEECGKIGSFFTVSFTGSLMSVVSSTVIFTLVMIGAYYSGQSPRNINLLLSELYS